MKITAERYIGQPVKKAVVTVPAYFNNSQKQATRDACKIAGLECLRIINEPTAAAMAAELHLNQSDQDESMTVLIFDLGGGTFDVSICEINEGIIDVVATHGDMLLGGNDFDEQLVLLCIEEFKRDTGIDVSENPLQKKRIRMACEAAKIRLTENEQTFVQVQSVEDHDLHIPITRD